MHSFVSGRARPSLHPNIHVRAVRRVGRLFLALRRGLLHGLAVFRPAELVQHVAPGQPPLPRSEWDNSRAQVGKQPALPF